MKIVADTVIHEMSRGELYDLVVAIDAGIGDREFTARLAEHFGMLKRIHDLTDRIERARCEEMDKAAPDLLKIIEDECS